MTFFEASLALYQKLKLELRVAESLCSLGYAEQQRGNIQLAQEHFKASLMQYDSRRDIDMIVSCIIGLARVAEAHGQSMHAARLLGIVEEQVKVKNLRLEHIERIAYDQICVEVRAMLDEASFATAWKSGRMLSLDQAVTEALATIDN